MPLISTAQPPSVPPVEPRPLSMRDLMLHLAEAERVAVLESERR